MATLITGKSGFLLQSNFTTAVRALNRLPGSPLTPGEPNKGDSHNRTERKTKMKSNYLRASSILAVLLVFVALGLTGTAQEPRTRLQQPAQQEERQLPELAVQQLDAEALRIAVPRQCHGITPVVQMHDVADSFAPTGSPVALSPALTSFLVGKPSKGYDDPGVNKYFGDSFKLRNCRVCYATLEVRVRHYNDVWTNDSITVGAAPFNTSPGVTLISTGIWNPPTPNPKTLSFALSTTALNNFLFSTTTVPSFLDVVAQDDTDFDYAKLSVWYY